MNLYPAILTGSIPEAQAQITSVASLPNIRSVQVDIIDGLFADNVTITPTDLAEIDFGELSCDLHLMTEEPLDFVYEAIDQKIQVPFRALIAQVEKMSHQADFLQTVRSNTWQIGLSLNLYTPIETIDEASWQTIDIIQLMAIEAGWQGQHFAPTIFNKIKEVKEKTRQLGRDVELIVDGGVKPEHLVELQQAGVESIAVGSGLWQAEDLQAAVAAYSGV